MKNEFRDLFESESKTKINHNMSGYIKWLEKKVQKYIEREDKLFEEINRVNRKNRAE